MASIDDTTTNCASCGKEGGNDTSPKSSSKKADVPTEMINSGILEEEGGEEVHDNEQYDDSKVYDYFPNPSIHNPTALETTKWWAENTSMHGMYYMFERGHFKTYKTFLWSAFVITCASLLLWALISEFQDFGQYNVDTSTKTIIPTSLVFPKVTLCNANRGIDGMKQNITGIVEPRNEEELRMIVQPVDEFILYTEFNKKVLYNNEQNGGDDSGALDLEQVWKPVITQSGMCYSFTTNEKVFVPGLTGGLLVHTWLNQSSYPQDVAWAGVQVFVTPNEGDSSDSNTVNDHKVISQSGTFVPPGAVSFVSVEMHDSQRVTDAPWSKCIPNGYSVDRYRMEFIMCSAREKCNCRLIGDGSSTQLDYCNSTNHECISTIGKEDEDVASSDDEQQDSAIYEKCEFPLYPPCQEQIYTMQYSAGRISQAKMNNANPFSSTAMNDDPELLSTNLVVIHINFASIQYESTKETKSTSTWQLFSNLGGSFGFFMGISIISIVELFVELIGLRLLPRLWGVTSLYGIGQKKFD